MWQEVGEKRMMRSCVTCSLEWRPVHYDDQQNKQIYAWNVERMRRVRNSYGILVENMKKGAIWIRTHRWTLRVKLWGWEMNSLGSRIVGRPMCVWYRTFGFHARCRILWNSENMAAFQDGLCERSLLNRQESTDIDASQEGPRWPGLVTR
jgi:hypothetical protein